jgi:hypothetical protein
LHYYIKTFKDIIANQSILTTLILSVIFYSAFYPTAYKAQQAETALNAYKYVMSLATLLQSHGSIHQFQTYLLQPNTRFIR